MVVAAASAWNPTRADVNDRRHNVMDRKEAKCLHTWPLKSLPDSMTPEQKLHKWIVWGGIKERTLAKESRCSVAAVIRSVFGAYGDQAVAVARCESGLYVYAQNGQYLGLFQMGEYARARYGHSWTALGQSRAAYAYFRDSGSDWSPWQCKPWGLAW